MMKSTSMRMSSLFLVVVFAAAGCSDEGEPIVVPDEEGPVSFAADIQPIFAASCVGCHGQDGNADLDLRPGVAYANLVDQVAQNSTGDLVTGGASGASVLYQRLTGVGGGIMPPGGALAEETVELVERWIDEGAAQN